MKQARAGAARVRLRVGQGASPRRWHRARRCCDGDEAGDAAGPATNMPAHGVAGGLRGDEDRRRRRRAASTKPKRTLKPWREERASSLGHGRRRIESAVPDAAAGRWSGARIDDEVGALGRVGHVRVEDLAGRAPSAWRRARLRAGTCRRDDGRRRRSRAGSARGRGPGCRIRGSRPCGHRSGSRRYLRRRRWWPRFPPVGSLRVRASCTSGPPSGRSTSRRGSLGPPGPPCGRHGSGGAEVCWASI